MGSKRTSLQVEGPRQEVSNTLLFPRDLSRNMSAPAPLSNDELVSHKMAPAYAIFKLCTPLSTKVLSSKALRTAVRVLFRRVQVESKALCCPRKYF